jgi:excisionase family DNA binding protein
MNTDIKRLFNDYLELTNDKVAAANLVLAEILSGHSDPQPQTGDLSAAEAAKRLRCSATTVYRLCDNGNMPHYRLGTGRGVIRIRIVDLAACQKIVRTLPADISAKRRKYLGV